MTKKKIGYLLVFILLLIGCICASLLVDFKTTNAKAMTMEKIVNIQDGIEYELNEKVSDTFLNGKTGVKFSTSESGKALSLKNKMAGEFAITFMPKAENSGVADFSKLSFVFSSKSSRLNFSLNFIQKDDAVFMRLIYSNTTTFYKDYAINGSFTNMANEPICFYFNPKMMSILDKNKNVLIDLNAKDLLDRVFTGNTLSAYDVYSVDIVFDEIEKDRKASVVVFDLCGQSFSSNTLLDTSMPTIYQDIVLENGVVGYPYTPSKAVAVYDLFDGVQPNFQGDIKIYNAENNQITLENGVFVPQQAGLYYAYYTPVDSQNNVGEVSIAEFTVLENVPKANFYYQFMLEDCTIGMGTTVQFPSAEVTSALTNVAVPADVSILLGEQEVFSRLKCDDSVAYTFTNSGEYTIIYKTVCGGITFEERFYISVEEDFPTFQLKINSWYMKDVVLDITESSCFWAGNEKEIRAITHYPSGRTQDSMVITLDEIGGYKIELYAEDCAIPYVKYFTVGTDNASLWEGDDAMIIQSNVDAPAYADYPYNGVMFTTASISEVYYKNPINVLDNTQNDLLCEFFIAPTTAGVKELSTIDIILTDLYDENNVITIRAVYGAWLQYNEASMVSLMGLTRRDFDNTTLTSIHPTNTIPYYYYNTRAYSSFLGDNNTKNGDYPSQSVKIYFDYQSGRVYADNSTKHTQFGGSGVFGKNLVCDLKDENNVGVGYTFKGFTTGEVKVSIRMAGMTTTAHVMMLNLDGQSLSGEKTVDRQAPSIFLDYKGHNEDALPLGVVGYEYDIFSAYYMDIVDGKSDNVKVQVYKKEETLIPQEHTSAYFIPNQAGEYILRYIATDRSGYTTIKDVDLKVIEKTAYQPLKYEFSEENQDEFFVGQKFDFVSGVCSGGTGNIIQNMYVLFDGEKVTLDKNNGFFVEKAGVYTIYMVLQDYLMKSQPFTFEVVASYAQEPILYKATMPKVIISGEEFVLPAFKAIQYSAANVDGVEVPVSFYANDEKIEGNTYTPQTAGDVVFRVVAGQTSEEYLVHVNQGVEGNKYNTGLEYMPQFVYTDASEKTMTNIAYELKFNKETNVSIARMIDAAFVDFKLSGNVENNFSEIYCTLTDSVNPAIQVTIKIVKRDEAKSYLYYGGEERIIDGSFVNSSLSFHVGFNAINNYITVKNRDTIQVKVTDFNEPFEGFTSGKVYLDFRFANVSGNSTLGIEEIAGQLFSKSIKMDRLGPVIKVLGDFTEVELGGKLIVPAAIAYDFINGVDSLKVSVVGGIGNKVLIDNQDATTYELVLTEVGEYKITYTAKDHATPNERTFVVTVVDRVPPTITLSGAVIQRTNVGKTVKLPSMQAIDDNTATEEILTEVYIIVPNGAMKAVAGYTFVAEQKGYYVVIYFAQDKDGATAMQRFLIEVS